MKFDIGDNFLAKVQKSFGFTNSSGQIQFNQYKKNKHFSAVKSYCKSQ